MYRGDLYNNRLSALADKPHDAFVDMYWHMVDLIPQTSPSPTWIYHAAFDRC